MSTRTLTFSGADLRVKALAVDDDKLVVDATSGKVGVGTTEPTESLDIVGNLNLQKVSNTATIKLNSNVVTEYTRSKKSLIKYPRVAMTANSSGGYVASASREYSSDYAAYKVFNGIYRSDGESDSWQPSTGETYSTANGTWTGGTGSPYAVTLTTGTTIYGEWVQLQMPTKIKLAYMNFSPIYISSGTYDNMGPHRSPREGYILGSNDGTNWTPLKNWTGLDYSYWNQYEQSFGKIDVNDINYYKYFRLVWTRTVGGTYAGYASAQEIEYYGVPEYDPEAHGTDVIMRSVPNVPNTDWLAVYYDGQDYTSMPSTVTDKSGNGVTGTPSGGVGFDTEYKAFTFDGVNDQYIDVTNVGNPSGNWSHSVSFWVKPLYDGSGNDVVFRLGPGADNEAIGFFYNATGIGYYFYANDFSATYTLLNKWYHITLTYDGDERIIYINGGQDIFSTTSGGGLLNLGGNDGMRIGTNQANSAPMTGSIANFRLFNRALTSDEVWQLYAYQKEYFGVSPDVVTFKGGRLGIGTSEPRAVLDVRGDTFSQKYNGGRSTFLTWDYTGTKTTSFAQPASDSGGTVASILDYEFDVPSCYHDLGTTTLKAYVNIDWRGELSNVPWNFLFRLKIYYNDYSSTYTLDSSIAPDNDSRGKGCGLPTISYHNNNDSTLEAASVTSQFTLPNCQVSKGSKIKVELLGVYTDTGAGAITLYTGRCVGSGTTLQFEMATSSFFVSLDVV